MEQENKKKKIVVAMIGVVILLVVVVGATYAFFSATDTEDAKQITTAKTELIVEIPENTKHITNIKPTTWSDDTTERDNNIDIVQIPITVTNKSTIDVKYFLRLSAIGLELNDVNDEGQSLTGGELSNVKYVLYDTTTGAKVTNPVATGDFTTPEVEQTIVNKKEIGKLNSEDNKPNIHNYILYVYIENIDGEQNKLQGIDFTINIKGNTRAPEETLATKILANETPITDEPNFSETSKDRGLYEMKTDKGKIYYYRGSEKAEVEDESYKPEYVMNNYVQFGTHTKNVTNKVADGNHIYIEDNVQVANAGDPMIWRIVRINEDRSVTLIAENNIGDSLLYKWNSKGRPDYVNKDEGKTDSEIKQTIDNWYRTTFESSTTGYEENQKLDSLVKVTEFCNDRQDLTGVSSAVEKRLSQNPPQPTLKCTDENDIVEAKAGLISADEMVYAGALAYKEVENNTTYLNNKTYFWTISSFRSYSVFCWYPHNLYLYNNDVAYTDNGAARPVITLSSDAPFTYDEKSEDSPGSEKNPYVISFK